MFGVYDLEFRVSGFGLAYGSVVYSAFLAVLTGFKASSVGICNVP